eukprot:gb/GECH01001464.1/.p1 GENE.gb/GECH01001464.1/~~gb/GECH01001464.1/.p1  ORF type:complete len:807 (+),score=212.10 gb/GECH01001464.1/:1-2421(+)
MSFRRGGIPLIDNQDDDGIPYIWVVAKYPFQAAEDNQISFLKEEYIKCYHTEKRGWWIGVNSTGRMGLFPSNYVNVVKETEKEESNSQNGLHFNKPKEYRPDLLDQSPTSTSDNRSSLQDLGFDDDDSMNDDSDGGESDSNETSRVSSKKVNEFQEEIERLKNLYEKAKSEKEEAIERAKNLVKTVEKNSTKNGVLKKQLDNLIGEKKKLTVALEDISKEHNIEIPHLKGIGIYNDSDHSESRSSLSNSGSLQNSAENSKQIKNMEEKIQNLQNQLNEKTSTEKDHQQLIADYEFLKKQNQDLERKMNQIRDDKKNSQNINTEIEKLRKENQGLKDKQSGLENELDRASNLRNQFEDLKKRYDVDIQQSTKTIDSLRNEIQQYKSKLVSTEQTKTSMSRRQTQQLKYTSKSIGECKASLLALRDEQLQINTEAKLFMDRLYREGISPMFENMNKAMKKYKQEVKERRKIYNQLQDMKGKIRVYCRARAPFSQEDTSQVNVPNLKEIQVTDLNRKKTHNFEFDTVFSGSSTQQEVFEDVKPLATSILDGYNVCIFAYGQTGSGKTYTMEGPPDNRGVNYRTLEELFCIRTLRQEEYDYTFEVAVMEIYNETVMDLLSPSKKRLEIRNTGETVIIPEQTRVAVDNMTDVKKVLHRGYRNRAVGATDLNEHSSRSHCIVSIYVKGINTISGTIVRGKLHLVDLAGSERVKNAGITGNRLKEAQCINKSLSALGNVIFSLAQKNGHVPFRDSKLTVLLQDSLGKESKVLMFVNISPSLECTTETLCSLKFASRVRSVELGEAKKHVEKIK